MSILQVNYRFNSTTTLDYSRADDHTTDIFAIANLLVERPLFARATYSVFKPHPAFDSNP